MHVACRRSARSFHSASENYEIGGYQIILLKSARSFATIKVMDKAR